MKSNLKWIGCLLPSDFKMAMAKQPMASKKDFTPTLTNLSNFSFINFWDSLIGVFCAGDCTNSLFIALLSSVITFIKLERSKQTFKDEMSQRH